MKRSKFTETQILKILAEAETGRKVVDVCREHGISQPTFYNWQICRDATQSIEGTQRPKERAGPIQEDVR